MPAGRQTVVTAANCGGYATTAARRAGFTVRYADGLGHLLQRLAQVPALAAGPAPGPATQRLRVRLAQTIARRRLRGVPRRGADLPLKLRDPRVLASDMRVLPNNMSPQRDHQVGEFLIRWLRHKN